MDIYPFQAWYPNLEQIPSADAFFGTVKEKYTSYLKDGFFKQLSEPALFIYRIQTRKRTYTGLMVCTNIEEYENGNILRHEETIALKEQKTLALILERQASVKPVLLTYPAVKQVTSVIQTYIHKHPSFYHTYFELEQQAHQIWKITEEDVMEELQKIFQTEVPKTYIADGHHRTSTMSLLKKQAQQQGKKGDFDHLLIALFGSDQLEINAFNRVITGCEDYPPAKFLEQLAQLGTLTRYRKPKKPTQKNQLTLFINGEWHDFKWNESFSETADKDLLLDVTLLNDQVLKGLLGIKDVSTDQRITYVNGTKGLAGLKKATLKTPSSIGFYLYPIQPDEFMTMARNNLLLPPKSTYFEPRIKNGLLVKAFE